MNITGKVKCPYCDADVEFEVKRGVDQTVELCIKCDKWLAVEAEIVVEATAHKIDSMNKG